MKYIIEIEDEPFGRNDDPVIPHGMDELWRARGFNSLVFDKEGLRRLEPYDEQSSYQKGYEAGFAEGRKRTDLSMAQALDAEYERGLEEAWNAARFMVNDLVDNHFIEGYMVDIFGCESCFSAFHHNTAAEAIEKIRVFEESRNKISVGDEVIICGVRAVVVKADQKGLIDRYIDAEGRTYGNAACVGNDEVKKTGRHFDQIEKLFEEMNK